MSLSPGKKVKKSTKTNVPAENTKKRKRSNSLTLPNKLPKRTGPEETGGPISTETDSGGILLPSSQETGTGSLQNMNKRARLVPPPSQGAKKTLDSLLMRTGSLADILKDEVDTWTDIAGNLKNVFLPLQKTADNPEFYVANLCTIYNTYTKGVEVDTLDDGQFLNDEIRKIREQKQATKEKVGILDAQSRTTGDVEMAVEDENPVTDQTEGPDQEDQEPNEVDRIADFLQKFMRANGQWDYINEQDWFTSGKFAIGIDVNYYPDRSGFKTEPAFHKDTGGNNLFVNLVFDNEQEIEATEWFADPEEPSTKRALWQQQLLPPSHLAELERSRKQLQEQLGENGGDVSGGVTTGSHTFVSWVDDLAWHSTPSETQRYAYTLHDAEAAYKGLTLASRQIDGYARNKLANEHTFPLGFGYYDSFRERTIKGAEILGTIADSPDTHLHRWLETRKKKAQDIDIALALEAWRELYLGQGGADRYREDVTKRAESPWRISGKTSEANAEDDRLHKKPHLGYAPSRSIRETPGGLSKRRRANSLIENRTAIKEARIANEGNTRSFLRTWVRILHIDDPDTPNE